MLRVAIKWIWASAVVVFVVYFIYQKQDVIVEAWRRLDATVILVALAAVALAKVLLVENMRLSADRAGIRLSFRDCYCMYHTTQMAKYIPGSVWQFVSRAALLRKRGLPIGSIRDSMLAETAWVLGTALLLGLLLTLSFDLRWVLAEFGGVIGNVALGLVLLAMFSIGVGWLYFKEVLKKMGAWGWSLRPPTYALLVLACGWTLMGLAFWVTLLPFSTAPISTLYCIGLYSLAFFIGFLTPFAPAGLGIREGILTVGISPYVGMDIAVFLAGLNRAVYVLAEIGLVTPCLKGLIRLEPTEDLR